VYVLWVHRCFFVCVCVCVCVCRLKFPTVFVVYFTITMLLLGE